MSTRPRMSARKASNTPPGHSENGRSNQRQRTRKDLLAAAGRLLKQGHTPTLDEVAAEAMVSRATAYRYFPNINALFIEAPLEGLAPVPAEVFAGDSSLDPAERVDKAEAALHAMCYRNAAQLRALIAASLERGARTGEDGEAAAAEGEAGDNVPVRQNRRTPLIEAALAPARGRFTKPAYDRLCAALALIFGPEAMIVFTDVLGTDDRTARRVKSWAARALVQAALDESIAGKTGAGERRTITPSRGTRR